MPLKIQNLGKFRHTNETFAVTSVSATHLPVLPGHSANLPSGGTAEPYHVAVETNNIIGMPVACPLQGHTAGVIFYQGMAADVSIRVRVR